MALDKNAFIAHFLEEAAENLEGIESRILVLRHDPQNQGELTTLLRELHTLKGSARMLKFPCLEKVSHGLEDVFKGVREGRYSISPDLAHLVMAACDSIRRSLAQIKATGDDSIPVEALLEAFSKAQANEPFVLPSVVVSEPKALPVEAVSPRPDHPEAESIRVKTERVEALLRFHNDLIIQQFQLKKENEALLSVETSLRDWARSEGEIGPQAYQALGLLSETRKRFLEQFTLIERSTRNVQKGLLELMMLPADLVLGPLPAMVEEMATSLGKVVQVSITGQDLGLDRLILDHLRDPLIHLVRNALDHGIETPDERVRAGKPPEGRITIACSTDSGSFVLKLSDDGRGLDAAKIRSRAQTLRPDRAAEIEALPEAALVPFLFEPGFSTKDGINEFSGRGLGLDIVRHEIEAVKGKVNLTSVAGAGSEFVLTLPLSLATVNGFFVEARGQKYLLPTQYIHEALVHHEANEIQLFHRRAVDYRDAVISVYSLGDLVEGAQEADAPHGHALVVEYLGEVLAIKVDRILQYISLIYQPMPPSLTAIKALQGFVFDENFDLVPILSVPELIEKFKRRGNFDTKKRFSEERPEYKRILVVDDSFTTREIEKTILELERYNVETAVDGIEALEMLKSRTYHLVVTDLNMPRMDGIILVDNLRRDERFRGLPIVVVSSEKDRDKRDALMKLGADRFLDKADFDRGHLAKEVRSLLFPKTGALGGRNGV